MLGREQFEPWGGNQGAPWQRLLEEQELTGCSWGKWKGLCAGTLRGTTSFFCFIHLCGLGQCGKAQKRIKRGEKQMVRFGYFITLGARVPSGWQSAGWQPSPTFIPGKTVFPVSLPGPQAHVWLTGPCVGAGCQHPSLSEPCWDGACSLQCISNPHGEHSGWVLKADWEE